MNFDDDKSLKVEAGGKSKKINEKCKKSFLKQCIWLWTWHETKEKLTGCNNLHREKTLRVVKLRKKDAPILPMILFSLFGTHPTKLTGWKWEKAVNGMRKQQNAHTSSLPDNNSLVFVWSSFFPFLELVWLMMIFVELFETNLSVVSMWNF